MGRASRTRKKEQRKKAKASRKAAMRTQYAAWRDEGRNKKSGRSFRSQVERRLVRNVRHASGPCGNVGCVRCSPLAAERRRRRLERMRMK